MNKSFYKSNQAKEEILALYQEKLDSLKIEYHRKNISTQFGETNVVIAGKPENPPLVLIHGANGNAAIALEPFAELKESHCLYAIDVIGQPNYSAESRPSMKDASYALWLDEILMSLNLTNVPVYGMSFGGFIILKALVNQSTRISEAVLHVPAGVVNGNPFIGIFKALIPMKRYIKTGDKNALNIFLALMFTKADDFAHEFLSKVILNMKMDFTPVPTLSKADAKKIKTKIHIIAAEKDAVFPGEKVIKRLGKITSTVAEVLLLKDCKHVPDEINSKKMLGFLKDVIK